MSALASRAERQTTLANIALQFYYVIDLQVNCAANMAAAAARCNTDVVLIYKMPLLLETHSVLCVDGEKCVTSDVAQMARRMAESQANISGYTTEYISKRKPIATTKVEAFAANHNKLLRQLKEVKAQMNDAMEDELRIDQEAKEITWMFNQKWKELDSQCNDEEVAGDGTQ